MKKFIEHAKFIRFMGYSEKKFQQRMFLMNRMFGTQFRAKKYVPGEGYQYEIF